MSCFSYLPFLVINQILEKQVRYFHLGYLTGAAYVQLTLLTGRNLVIVVNMSLSLITSRMVFVLLNSLQNICPM
ncbi:hypothetical protein BX661DRAFT_178531 [Kickxella alabastrina]|uniref:uncharacterized protein n=1 Tax=Kickxella alabastrina TaxID=61397 RepID=UPI00221EE585|nr:uncharacterized protein BX661DRAFT_178531 [Kickxella alabastrina]KAI7833507.1 hypothetical protein BX661DRAFT_178531 [Kickxella alabastrina]